MTCHEFWNEMPELAGESELLDHAGECPACAARLRRQQEVAAGLSRLSQDLKPRQAPRRVERRLVKAFRAQAGINSQLARRYWPAWAAAAALVLAMAWWTVGSAGKHSGPPAFPQTVALLADTDAEFIPLPYGSADPGNSFVEEDTDLVRLEVPRTALIALGLPVALSGSTRVEAEVALGADGMLQGLRIVQ